jgi:hypothetical protein
VAHAPTRQTRQNRRRIGIAEQRHFIIDRGQSDVTAPPRLLDSGARFGKAGPKARPVVGIKREPAAFAAEGVDPVEQPAPVSGR